MNGELPSPDIIFNPREHPFSVSSPLGQAVVMGLQNAVRHSNDQVAYSDVPVAVRRLVHLLPDNDDQQSHESKIKKTAFTAWGDIGKPDNPDPREQIGIILTGYFSHREREINSAISLNTASDTELFTYYLSQYQTEILSIDPDFNAVLDRWGNIFGIPIQPIATEAQPRVPTFSERILERGRKAAGQIGNAVVARGGQAIVDDMVNRSRRAEINPYEMESRPVELNNISLVRISNPAYGNPTFIIDSRSVSKTKLPRVITPDGRRVRLKRISHKGDDVYALYARFDSQGHIEYLQHDASRPAHLKIELIYHSDRPEEPPELTTSVNKSIPADVDLVSQNNPLREIADSEYAFCQGSEARRARIGFLRDQDDEVLIHIRNDRDYVEGRDNLENRFLITNTPVDPSTFSLTLLTDKGELKVRPRKPQPKNEKIFENLSVLRARRFGIKLTSRDLLYHVAAVRDDKGRYLITDGSKRSLTRDSVDVFVVRREGKKDRVYVVDRSNGVPVDHAPFLSGVSARRLRDGEREDFEIKMIKMAPKIEVEETFNSQLFDIPLGDAKQARLSVRFNFPDATPVISLENNTVMHGFISVSGDKIRSDQACEAKFLTDDSNNFDSFVTTLTRDQISLLRRNPVFQSPRLKKVIQLLPHNETIYAITTQIRDKNAVPAKLASDNINSRTFLFFRYPFDGDPYKIVCIQLEPKSPSVPSLLKEVKITNIPPIPSEKDPATQYLAYTSGTRDRPSIYSSRLINSTFKHTPVVFDYHRPERLLPRRIVVDRRAKNGEVIDLIDITSGHRTEVKSIGSVGFLRSSPITYLDAELNKALHNPDIGISASDRIYLIGLCGKKGREVCDLSKDRGYLASIGIKRGTGKAGRDLEYVSEAVATRLKRSKRGRRKESEMSMVLVIENRLHERRYVVIDRSRNSYSESSLVAGIGFAMLPAEEQTRVAEIRAYWEMVEAEKGRRVASIGKRATQAALSTVAAGIIAGTTTGNTTEVIPRYLPPTKVRLVVAKGDIINDSGNIVEYRPVSTATSFDYREKSRDIISWSSDGESGVVEGILHYGQLVREGVGQAISGYTLPNGQKTTLFASPPPVPFTPGNERSDGLLPHPYTSTDIDGRLGYMNDAGQVRPYEFKDSSGNVMYLTATDYQLGDFISRTDSPIYEMKTPYGYSLLVEPANMSNESGTYTFKVSGVIAGDENAAAMFLANPSWTLPPVEDFIGKSRDQVIKMIQERRSGREVINENGESRIELGTKYIDLTKNHYTPLRFTDSSGDIVAQADYDMTLLLADAHSSDLEVSGKSPVVYRYYENGRLTDRFVVIKDGNVQEVARFVQGKIEGSGKVVYRKNITVVESRLASAKGEDIGQPATNYPHGLVKTVWVESEVLDNKVSVDTSTIFEVDPANPDKIISFYKLRGKEGVYDKFYRVEFDGITDQEFFTTERQMTGESLFVENSGNIKIDTVIYGNKFGEGVAYWIDDRIDLFNEGDSPAILDPDGRYYHYSIHGTETTQRMRIKELHPPNVFAVKKDDGGFFYRYDNKYYVSDPSQHFTQEFDHLPSVEELKASLPATELVRITGSQSVPVESVEFSPSVPSISDHLESIPEMMKSQYEFLAKLTSDSIDDSTQFLDGTVTPEFKASDGERTVGIRFEGQLSVAELQMINMAIEVWVQTGQIYLMPDEDLTVKKGVMSDPTHVAETDKENHTIILSDDWFKNIRTQYDNMESGALQTDKKTGVFSHEGVHIGEEGSEYGKAVTYRFKQLFWGAYFGFGGNIQKTTLPDGRIVEWELPSEVFANDTKPTGYNYENNPFEDFADSAVFTYLGGWDGNQNKDVRLLSASKRLFWIQVYYGVPAEHINIATQENGQVRFLNEEELAENIKLHGTRNINRITESQVDQSSTQIPGPVGNVLGLASVFTVGIGGADHISRSKRRRKGRENGRSTPGRIKEAQIQFLKQILPKWVVLRPNPDKGGRLYPFDKRKSRFLTEEEFAEEVDRWRKKERGKIKVRTRYRRIRRGRGNNVYDDDPLRQWEIDESVFDRLDKTRRESDSRNQISQAINKRVKSHQGPTQARTRRRYI